MTRIVTWLAAVTGVTALALFVGLYYLSPLLYAVTPPAPHFAKPPSEAEAQRDDLNYLRNFTVLDWSFTSQTRAAANAIIDRALRGPLPLSRGDFQLTVARVAAAADNGHSNIWGATSANRCNRLPVRFYVFADGVFVVRALPQARQALGGQILAIDGMPIERVRSLLDPFTGGSAGEKNARLPFYLESPELLHAAGISKNKDRVSLLIRTEDSRELALTLAALPPNPHAPKLWPSEELKPVANAGEGAQWLAALKGRADRLPIFENAPHAFFFGKLRRPDAFYVRFDTNGDDGDTSIVSFAARAKRALLATNPSSVIVDLRMNGGGDYTNTAKFMRGAPLWLPHARFFVLISQETFSAGMSDAAFLKQAGDGRVVFVGDWPGDRIRFHSEGDDFCLPYSHLCMTARTAIHDYSTSWCRPFFECYFLDRYYPAAIASFAPEIPAPLTYAALSHGHDPALDAITRIEASQQTH